MPLPRFRAAPRWAALALIVALAACQSETSMEAAEMDAMELESVAADMSLEARASGPTDGLVAGEVGQAPVPGAQPATALADRQLIRTSSVRMRAVDHGETTARARALVASAGGFVGNESSQRYADRVETTLTLRVPSDRFDSLLAAVSALDGEVVSRSVSVDDVTRQVADVAARLETKRAAETQYRALLSRSGSIEDVLAVQTRLQQVREEIESTEAQLRALRDQIGLSTIHLTLFEASAAGITAGPGFFSRAGRSVVEGWESVLEFSLGLLSVWPFLLVLGAVVWFLRRRLERRRTRRETMP